MMKDLDVPKIEMDEIWVIVQKIVPRMKNYEGDGAWMWVAFVLSSSFDAAVSKSLI